MADKNTQFVCLIQCIEAKGGLFFNISNAFVTLITLYDTLIGAQDLAVLDN